MSACIQSLFGDLPGGWRGVLSLSARKKTLPRNVRCNGVGDVFVLEQLSEMS